MFEENLFEHPLIKDASISAYPWFEVEVQRGSMPFCISKTPLTSPTSFPASLPLILSLSLLFDIAVTFGWKLKLVGCTRCSRKKKKKNQKRKNPSMLAYGRQALQSFN